MPKRQLRMRKSDRPLQTSKKMLKKTKETIQHQRPLGKRIPKKRKFSSSSSGNENNSEDGRESLESGEIVFTPKKRLRRQAQGPKVEVEQAIEFQDKYDETYDQPTVYFEDDKERPEDEEEEDEEEEEVTPEDYEVQYVSVPVRVPKGARVSVPMGALGRVEVDQGGGYRRQMALVDDQPSTSTFVQYPQVDQVAGQQQQAKGPVRIVIARPGVGITRLQEYSQQLQAHQQHPEMYYQNEEDIGAYMEL